MVIFFFSCHLSPYLQESCLISWQNLFMKHFKCVSCQSGAPPPPPNPPPGLQSLKPPISITSSDKIVYAPRGESGHANSSKVRSTWPKVIATESYLERWQPSAYGLGPSFPRSTARDHLRPRATNLTLAAHSIAFVSLRVIYYSPCMPTYTIFFNIRNFWFLDSWKIYKLLIHEFFFNRVIIIDMIFRIILLSNIGGFGRGYVHHLSGVKSFAWNGK